MPISKYPNEIKINPNQGGKAAIERLIEPYGFTTRQALADHLDVSKSTLSNRYMRDTFPADWIIQCALKTGVSLRWLATADGLKHLDVRTQVMSLPKKIINNGKLIENGYLIFGLSLPPKEISNISAIESDNAVYIIRRNMDEIEDGLWVMAIDDIFSVRELARLPNNRVMLKTNSKKNKMLH